MTKTLFMLFVFCMATGCSDIIDRTGRSGLYGTITYHVIDDDGEPVSDACVRACFIRQSGDNIVVKASTDSNGYVTVKAKTNLEVRTSITKDGYYKGFDRYMFFTSDVSKMSPDGWKAFPTNTVVFRKIRNPKPFRLITVNAKSCKTQSSACFDLVSGEFIRHDAPTANACICFSWRRIELNESGTKFRLELDLSVPESDENDSGFIYCKTNVKSSFFRPYKAPDSGYSAELKLANVDQCKERMPFPQTKGEYIIFKIREQHPSETTENCFRYGVITRLYASARRGDDTATISFDYIVNEENDKNLEYSNVPKEENFKQ